MAELALPALFVVLLWWASTGIVLRVVALPASAHRHNLLAATALLLGGLAGLWALRDTATVAGAYLAFTAALVVWAWHELTFLQGQVAGPRTLPCPPGCRGWERFRLATLAVLNHEILIALTAALVVALTWGGANQVGTWTFLVLWLMRLSAKLNVFLGVPSLSEELLPAHLAVLRSYFGRRPMNLLFPVSITASTVAAVLLLQAALAAGDPFAATGLALIATLLLLALVEHWFLVLPIQDAALWRWALPAQRPATAPGSPADPSPSPQDGLRGDDHGLPSLLPTGAGRPAARGALPRLR